MGISPDRSTRKSASKEGCACAPAARHRHELGSGAGLATREEPPRRAEMGEVAWFGTSRLRKVGRAVTGAATASTARHPLDDHRKRLTTYLLVGILPPSAISPYE